MSVMSNLPSLAVYLLCRTLPKGNLLNQFFRLDIKGCFTEDDSQELLDILKSGFFQPESNVPGNPAWVEWGNQLRRLGFITQSPQLFELFESVKKVAKTDATVLITGENGTGKEVVAGSFTNSAPSRTFIHGGAYRGHSRESSGIGTVWACSRSLYFSSQRSKGEVRGEQRRNHFSG